MTASILAVVLGAIFSLSETTAKLAPNDAERALVVDDARAALARITRDARQATSAVVSASGYSLTVQVGGVQITYTCNVPHPTISGRSQCTRTSGSGSPVVVNHLVNVAAATPVFVQDGRYVRVRLRVATTGDRKNGHKHAVTLDDGAFVRNSAP